MPRPSHCFYVSIFVKYVLHLLMEQVTKRFAIGTTAAEKNLGAATGTMLWLYLHTVMARCFTF
jgi:hypothetical protein